MSDFKSKLPNLKELGEMTGKLFKDIKTSVGEIIDDYKQKHPQASEAEKPAATTTEAKPTVTPQVTPEEKNQAINPEVQPEEDVGIIPEETKSDIPADIVEEKKEEEEEKKE